MQLVASPPFDPPLVRNLHVGHAARRSVPIIPRVVWSRRSRLEVVHLNHDGRHPRLAALGMHHTSRKEHGVADFDVVAVRSAGHPAPSVDDDEELTESGLVFTDFTARLEVQHVGVRLSRPASQVDRCGRVRSIVLDRTGHGSVESDHSRHDVESGSRGHADPATFVAEEPWLHRTSTTTRTFSPAT